MTPLQREALQMCLEYIETDAHERRHVRWKINEALEESAQQEPVAFIKGRGWRNGNLEVIPAKMNQTFEIDQPLYTSPPAQRKPLTDEEIEKLASKHLDVGDGAYGTHYVFGEINFARAIEAAHGITGEQA